ncbi:uncharacterized protein PAC_13754 [Phialocephala subalpina]|uniref:Protein YAE1 n=1 Tax=Phialocephala subalpina TaxID=576137 RepID=A0A1L7XFY4_9HELO|nr:uncharacterized protein PAC_13754 [Phialocephala subalpina]
MLRDDDAFPMPSPYGSTPTHELNEDTLPVHDDHYANDDLDDVFGSAPPSPSLEPSNHDRNTNEEYSDIPRLKEKHETEGYRDGVTKGKGESVQVGFDEGYGLGAVLGLRIGKVLGLLEGILGAVKAGEGVKWDKEKKRMEVLFTEAQKELSTQSVFGREYWGEDGIWIFKVPGEEDNKDVVFEDVAGAHPLVRKWEGLVEEEVKRWGLDLEIMDGEHDEDEEAKKDIVSRKDAVTMKEVASESIGPVGNIMGVPKGELNW